MLRHGSDHDYGPQRFSVFSFAMVVSLDRVRSLPLQVHGRLAPRHLQFDCEDEFPVEGIARGFILVDFLGVRQPFAHCNEPRAFLAFEGLFIDLLHHRSTEAGAICKDHV